MGMNKGQEKEHAIRQARGIIANYVTRGNPELESILHGIRVLKGKGWHNTYYGRCAIKWLEDRARQLRRDRQYRLAARRKVAHQIAH